MSRKGFAPLIILLAIAGAAVLGIVGYLVIKRQMTPPVPQALPVPHAPVAGASSTPVVGVTTAGQRISDGATWTCREFVDKSKNFVVGQVVVGFKSGVTVQQAEDVIQSLGGTISMAQFNDPTYPVTIADWLAEGGSLLVRVPEGQESSSVTRFLQNNLVRYAELHGCNSAELLR
jgi:hypothetical protein